MVRFSSKKPQYTTEDNLYAFIRGFQRKPAKNPYRRTGTTLGKLIQHRKKTLLSVKRIMCEIDKMLEPAGTPEIIAAYNSSIENLLSKGIIPTKFKSNTPMFGCKLECELLYKCLNRMGIPARMTREIIGSTPHSRVLFHLNGEFFEADPFMHQKISKFTLNRKKEISKKIKKGEFSFIHPGQLKYVDYAREKRTQKVTTSTKPHIKKI